MILKHEDPSVQTLLVFITALVVQLGGRALVTPEELEAAAKKQLDESFTKEFASILRVLP